MTYHQIMRAIMEDGQADTLFGIEQLPRIPDGSVMFVYLIAPENPAFKYIEEAGMPRESYWFVVHAHGQGADNKKIGHLLYTYKGKPVDLPWLISKLLELIEDDDNWYLVRDLSTADKPLFVRQRSLP